MRLRVSRDQKASMVPRFLSWQEAQRLEARRRRLAAQLLAVPGPSQVGSQHEAWPDLNLRAEYFMSRKERAGAFLIGM